jgi:hypothetical protein
MFGLQMHGYLRVKMRKGRSDKGASGRKSCAGFMAKIYISVYIQICILDMGLSKISQVVV